MSLLRRLVSLTSHKTAHDTAHSSCPVAGLNLALTESDHGTAWRWITRRVIHWTNDSLNERTSYWFSDSQTVTESDRWSDRTAWRWVTRFRVRRETDVRGSDDEIKIEFIILPICTSWNTLYECFIWLIIGKLITAICNLKVKVWNARRSLPRTPVSVRTLNRVTHLQPVRSRFANHFSGLTRSPSENQYEVQRSHSVSRLSEWVDSPSDSPPSSSVVWLGQCEVQREMAGDTGLVTRQTYLIHSDGGALTLYFILWHMQCILWWYSYSVVWSTTHFYSSRSSVTLL